MWPIWKWDIVPLASGLHCIIYPQMKIKSLKKLNDVMMVIYYVCDNSTLNIQLCNTKESII